MTIHLHFIYATLQYCGHRYKNRNFTYSFLRLASHKKAKAVLKCAKLYKANLC